MIRVIYRRGFVDRATNQKFTANLSLKGWRLSIINALVRVLTLHPVQLMRGSAFFLFAVAFVLAELGLTGVIK